METYKDLLLWYVHEKNKVIEKETGLKLYYKKDFERFESIDEESCKKFFVKNQFLNDIDICPDCSFVNSRCSLCGYKKIHKLDCFDPESHYRKIISRLVGNGGYSITITTDHLINKTISLYSEKVFKDNT